MKKLVPTPIDPTLDPALLLTDDHALTATGGAGSDSDPSGPGTFWYDLGHAMGAAEAQIIDGLEALFGNIEGL